MAVPITVGGQIVVLPSQSDKFAWGTAVTSAIVLLAANSIQVTGGLQSLTAELDLGAAFGLKVLYVKSRTANPAATGFARLANGDAVVYRNQANNADLPLGPGNGTTTPIDQLVFNGTQITGQCFAEYNNSASPTIPNSTPTVINYLTKVTDTDNAVTIGAGWIFTVPTNKAGQYFVDAQIVLEALTLDTGSFQLLIQKNASPIVDVRNVAKNGTTWTLQKTTIVNAVVGDTINVQVTQTNGAGRALSVNASENRITIKRLV